MSMLCFKALGVYKYHTSHFPLTFQIGWIRPETHSGDIHMCRRKPPSPPAMTLSGSFVLPSSWADSDSVIDWSWVNPIMQCVAEPCGQTAVYIRALISLPGDLLQI